MTSKNAQHFENYPLGVKTKLGVENVKSLKIWRFFLPTTGNTLDFVRHNTEKYGTLWNTVTLGREDHNSKVSRFFPKSIIFAGFLTFGFLSTYHSWVKEEREHKLEIKRRKIANETYERGYRHGVESISNGISEHDIRKYSHVIECLKDAENEKNKVQHREETVKAVKEILSNAGF
jgi:hypothetical protein